jgi:hypothetical protein
MAMPARTRRRFQVRWWVWILVGLIAMAGLAWATSGGTGRLPRVSDEVWDAPEVVVAEGSALATAKTFLDAFAEGDYEAAAALLGVPRSEAAAELRRGGESAGGVRRHRLVSEQVIRSDPDWPGSFEGEGRVVWAAVGFRKMGEFAIILTLGRLADSGEWRVFDVSSQSAYAGLVGPPPFTVPPEALVPLTRRERPLDVFADAILSAVLAREATSQVAVVVSPKVELFFTLGGLAGAPEFCSNSGSRAAPLGKEALAWFKDAREHPAVTAMAQLHGSGFSYDAVAALPLYFSDPPALEPVFPLSDYLIGRSFGIDRVERESRLLEVVELARRFAREVDFGAYMEAKRVEYEALLQAVTGRLPAGIPTALERYYGDRRDAYVVAVSGLSGNYGPTLIDGDWTCLVAIVNPGLDAQGAGIRDLLLHEWGHSFVNPVVAENRSLAMEYEHLFDAIQEEMTKGGQAYGQWETALVEHVLRAATARIVLATFGGTEAETHLTSSEARGFKYIRPLYERLAVYEADRELYPTFADFFPELMKALDDPGGGGGS